MDERINFLKNLGLTDKEGLVYLTMVELGPSLVAQIARQAGLHRPELYRIIPSLQNKGLVSVAPKGKQKRFVAETPEKLGAMFESVTANFGKLLPELNELYDKQSKRPIIKYLEGGKGVSFLLQDLLATLKRGEVYYRYASHRAVTEMEKYVPKSFGRDRDAKQIERFVITDELTDQQKKNPTLLRAHKIISVDQGLFDDNIVQLIYKDRVAIAERRSGVRTGRRCWRCPKLA